MTRFHRVLTGTALVSACLLPLASQASSVYHAANNEAGVVQHLDHFQSTKSRDQVKAEVAEARRDGTLQRTQGNASNYPATRGDAAATGLTRADVLGQLMHESAADRLTRLQGLSGG